MMVKDNSVKENNIFFNMFNNNHHRKYLLIFFCDKLIFLLVNHTIHKHISQANIFKLKS